MMCADLAAAKRPSPIFDELLRAAVSPPDFGERDEWTNGACGALLGWAKWFEKAGDVESDSPDWMAFEIFRGESDDKAEELTKAAERCNEKSWGLWAQDAFLEGAAAGRGAPR